MAELKAEDEEEQKRGTFSVADELIKLADLLDKGIMSLFNIFCKREGTVIE